MKIIKELCSYIDEEIDGAKTYAENALKYKEENPDLAKMFYNMSLQEMEHMNELHKLTSSRNTAKRMVNRLLQ